jgi:hypothetical protein
VVLVTLWATRRPPHTRGLRSQQDSLRRAIRSLGLPECQRVALETIAACADGAGFCFKKTGTIARESGYDKRTIQRALRELQAETPPLLRRWPLLRDPRNYERRSDLPYRARQGQGPTISRLGVLLRRRAALHELDEAEALGLVELVTPEIERVLAAEPAAAEIAAGGALLSPPTVTPEIEPKPLQSRGRPADEPVTPQRRTERSHPSKGRSLDPDEGPARGDALAEDGAEGEQVWHRLARAAAAATSHEIEEAS